MHFLIVVNIQNYHTWRVKRVNEAPNMVLSDSRDCQDSHGETGQGSCRASPLAGEQSLNLA